MILIQNIGRFVQKKSHKTGAVSAWPNQKNWLFNSVKILLIHKMPKSLTNSATIFVQVSHKEKPMWFSQICHRAKSNSIPKISAII